MVENNVFKPGKLPSNEYAYHNAIFVNPADFDKLDLYRYSNRYFVQIKQFVLELKRLPEIPVGEFAASSLQKDMLRISKIDSVQIQKARNLENNLLNSVEIVLDLVYCDP